MKARRNRRRNGVAGHGLTKRRRWRNESSYQIIRRPVITEKGLAIKELQNTLVFQVAPKATKTETRKRCSRFSK